MSLNNGTADGQSQSQALALRGYEGLEDLVDHLAVDADPVVSVADLDRAVRAGARGNPQQAIVRWVLFDGIAGIQEKIQKYLLQLHAVALDPGGAGREFGHHLDVPGDNLAVQHPLDLGNFGAQIEELAPRLVVLKERAQMA